MIVIPSCVVERPYADVGDGVADGDARQAAAIFERIVADVGDGVADDDSRQAGAVIVSITNYLSALSLLNGRKVKP